MNKLLWIIAFGLLFSGGGIIFYLKAPKGSLDNFKDKISEILPWGGDKGAKDKGDGPELPTGLPPTDTSDREEETPDVTDTSLPDGLPELPPVPIEGGTLPGDGGITESRATEDSEEVADGDDFTVEIFTENTDPVY